MRKRLLGFYDYTVVLTYCGMLAAFWGILQAIGRHYGSAVVGLMLAGCCDLFDGAVASTKERSASERRFGIQIDSLSDLISFGALPAVLVYMLLDGQHVSAGLFGGVYLLCALIRLAYFNVTEEERQERAGGKREYYLGLPVTSIAVLLPAVYLMFALGIFRSGGCFLAMLALTALGFVLPVEIRKPRTPGKIVFVAFGILEALAVIFFLGRGAV